MEIRRTRVSIPTQLREAGHEVHSRVGNHGQLEYVVDGEAMGLKDAADRFLEGGWKGSFGRPEDGHTTTTLAIISAALVPAVLFVAHVVGMVV